MHVDIYTIDVHINNLDNMLQECFIFHANLV